MNKLWIGLAGTLLALGGGVLFTGCELFGVQDNEEAAHKILKKDGNIEIRQYEDMIVAETTVVGSDYDRAGNRAFRILAAYIFGNNVSQKKIKMTIPVYLEKEKIKMTTPVLKNKTKEGWTFQFVMPKKWTMKTLPKPKDKRVKLKKVKGYKVAVLRYSGFMGERRMKKKAKILKRWIKKKGHKITSKVRGAGYNPPWTLPPFRRNEVMFEIE